MVTPVELWYLHTVDDYPPLAVQILGGGWPRFMLETYIFRLGAGAGDAKFRGQNNKFSEIYQNVVKAR